jgi:hypothetical protein
VIEPGEKSKATIKALFPSKHTDLVAKLLENECGDNLVFCENYSIEQMERIRLAALKLSKGDIKELQNVIALAQTDWRDLLVSAGFGSDLCAHLKWADNLAKKT